MMYRCRICGCGYPEEWMDTEDVCIYCRENVIHDMSIKDGQLF